jgi:peroxiredoxin Q/BCP
MADTLNVGDKAPDFHLPTDTFDEITLSKQHGKKVVLYFYPKDNTPGCTQQAEEFTAALEDFKSAGAIVLGVSKDDPESHESFKQAKCIAFTLVSDIEGKTLENYGVWVEKNMYGKKYMGIERSTFLINKDGKIHKIWRKVSVKGHVAEVLEAVKGM